MRTPTVYVFFVGEPRTAEAIRLAISGLERVKRAAPEEAVFIAEATLKSMLELVRSRRSPRPRKSKPKG